MERYSRSPREWEESFKNRDIRAKILTEILAVGSATNTGKGDKGREKKAGAALATANNDRATNLAPSPFNTQQAVGGGDGDAENGGKGKEKRRRQRGRGRRGKSCTGGAADAGEGGGDGAHSAGGRETPTDSEGGGVGAQKKAAVANTADDEAKPTRKKGNKETDEVEQRSNLISKKKKRKRQEGEVEVTTGGGAGNARENKVDLSFVMDAIRNSVSAEKQTTAASKDKKKKKREVAAADSHGGERGGDSVLPASKVEKAPKSAAVNRGVLGQGMAGRKVGKKKKEPKRDNVEGVTKFEESSSRRKTGSEKEEAGGWGGVAPKADARSGKKRRKASSSSGFRLF